MNLLSKTAFSEIRNWIYRNARPLDLALWQYSFENGGREAVVNALSFYQNQDGGFGNALEPDCWNPNSTPYTTLNAVAQLNKINFTETSHPIMRGIIQYFESGEHFTGSGWLFSVPSNNNYPCAPWWTYDPKANAYEHIGVTLGIVCFALQYVNDGTELYKRAFALASELLMSLEEPGDKGDMGLYGYCMLLEKIKQLGMTDRFDMELLYTTLKKYIDEAIVRDVSKWGDYGVKPSQFITSPDSPFYKGNEEIVEKELDYLIETRPQNDVWGITWQWWNHYEKYPKEFAISENWWKSDIAIDKIKFLQRFKRLE